VEIGTAKGRSVKPKLKVGICGEHGGDPESVKFFHRAGLDYVSCSPFRIPIAKLAAAQAALEDR
jgi:pyruvate,orthophosphate dikinase